MCNEGGWWEEIQKKTQNTSQVRLKDNTDSNYLALKQEIVFSSFEDVFPISRTTKEIPILIPHVSIVPSENRMTGILSQKF